MKHYPEQIQETQGFITGLQAGIQTLQQQEAAEAAAVPMLSNTNMIMDKEDALWTANLLI